MKPTIYWIDHSQPGRLAILARPRGNDWLNDEIVELAKAEISVVVSLLDDQEAEELGLAQESNVVNRHGLKFIRFPIPDYGVPTKMDDVFRLVRDLDAQLCKGLILGIHCRQGIGRSSLVAACVLSTASENVSLCFKRISEARGTHVPDTTEQEAWVKAFAQTYSPQLMNR